MRRSDERGREAGARPGGGLEWTVDFTAAGQRLDKFLATEGRAGSRSRASDAIERGRVFVNGVEAGPADRARLVAAGDVIRFWIDRPGRAARPTRPRTRDGLELLHADDDLVVVNKPAGLLTVPLDGDSDAPSVLDLLEQRYRSHGGREPLVVHRIDRDTSGVVLFALNPRARGALTAQFAERTPERVYLAVVQGRPEPAEGTWRDRLIWDEDTCLQRPARAGDRDAVDAVCHYRLVEAFDGASLVEIRLETGRQGQIRVQAQLRGHALIGDRRYIDRSGLAAREIPFPRQALHAHRLAFAHPSGGRRVEVTAPLPADLSSLIATLTASARLARGGKGE
jgi:23S rRNA pseudouridine1911/1915/1917 synthase